MAGADDEARDFSPGERKAIRMILQSQERAQWFWSTVRVWAAWLAAIVAGIYGALEVISKHIKFKIGG